MADRITVHVEGARELRAALKRAGADLADLTRTNRRVSSTVTAAALKAAPRKSGKLAGSIKAAATRTRASVRSRLVYAGVIHWGWPRRRIRSQPFVQAAAKATEPTWRRTYEADIRRIIDGIRTG